MRQSSKRTIPVFAAIAVLTLGSTLVVYWAGLRVTAANAKLARSREIVAGLEDTLSTLKDAETGQRGFLLTSDARYIEPYDAAVHHIGENLERLRQWVQTGDIAANSAAAVARMVQEKLDEVKLTIELCRGKSWEAASAGLRSDIGQRIMDSLRGQQATPRQQGSEAALAVVRLDLGKQVMDGLRRQIAGLADQEQRQADFWRQQRDRADTLRTLLTLALALIDLAFLGWAFHRISTGIAATEHAAAETSRQKELLRESEERLRTMVDAIPQLAWIANADGWIHWYNRQWYEYTGTTPQQMEGWGWQSVHNPETLPAVLERWKASIATGQPFDMVFPLRGADGIFRPFLTRVQPMKDAQGRVVQWFGTNTDVDELKRVEEALRKSEQRYRAFVEASSQVVWTVNAGAEVDLEIPAWQAYTGQSAEEARGLGWMNAIHPDDRPAVAEAWRKAIESRGLYEVEYRLRIYDGTWRDVLARGVPVKEADGTLREYIGTCIDITDRKRAEDALKESERRFRALVTATSDVVYRMSPDWREMRQLVGQEFLASTEEPDRNWLQKYIHPDDQQHVMAAIGEAIAAKSVFELEHRVRTADGSLGWTFSRAIPLLDAKGEITEWFGAASDVTERKGTEEAQALLAAIVESSDDAILSKDLHGTILSWNAGAEQLFGYGKEEIVGQSIMLLLPPERVEEEQQILARLRRGERVEHIETERVAKDGRRIDVSVTVSPLKDRDGHVVGASKIIHDITERKRTQETLRQSEERYHSLFTEQLEGFCIIEVLFDADNHPIDYRFLEINPAFEAQTGLHNAQGKRMRELAPEHEAHWFEIYGKVALTGEPARFVNEARALNRWYDVSAYRVGGPDSRKVAILFNDISEAKRAEQGLKRTAEELARSNKDLEQFAYVASHDLQEPLRMVTGYLQLIERRYKDQLDQDAREFINFAVDGGTRMSRLIMDLLEYSRVNTRGKQPQAVEVEAVLNRALENLRAAISDSGAQVTHGPLPTIRADAAQLTQLLQNLVSNAIKFRSPDRPAQVYVGAERKDDGWVFSVKDNGIGIEPRYAEKIFLIFQRLHGRGEYPGTGIGLAICKKIVERHGGRIWVESQPGQGSTFFFTLGHAEVSR